MINHYITLCCIHAVGDKQDDCLKSLTTVGVLSFRLSDLWLGQGKPVQSMFDVSSSHMASSSGRSALDMMAVLDSGQSAMTLNSLRTVTNVCLWLTLCYFCKQHNGLSHACWVQWYALRRGEVLAEMFDALQIVNRQTKLYDPLISWRLSSFIFVGKLSGDCF